MYKFCSKTGPGSALRLPNQREFVLYWGNLPLLIRYIVLVMVMVMVMVVMIYCFDHFWFKVTITKNKLRNDKNQAVIVERGLGEEARIAR